MKKNCFYFLFTKCQMSSKCADVCLGHGCPSRYCLAYPQSGIVQHKTTRLLVCNIGQVGDKKESGQSLQSSLHNAQTSDSTLNITLKYGILKSQTSFP